MRTYFTGRNGLVTLITVLCIVTVRHPAAAGAGVPQDAIIYGCVDANSGRIRLVFCSMACWDAHLPDARHRKAWAVDERATTQNRPG